MTPDDHHWATIARSLHTPGTPMRRVLMLHPLPMFEHAAQAMGDELADVLQALTTSLSIFVCPAMVDVRARCGKGASRDRLHAWAEEATEEVYAEPRFHAVVIVDPTKEPDGDLPLPRLPAHFQHAANLALQRKRQVRIWRCRSTTQPFIPLSG